MLEENELHELVRLQTHWDEHYQIMIVDGVWRATRLRHASEVITADSARELRGKLKDDYAELASGERFMQAMLAEGSSL